MKKSLFVVFLSFLCVAAGVFVFFSLPRLIPSRISSYSFGVASLGAAKNDSSVALFKMLFVGDIMLGRGVAYFSEKNRDEFYPFRQVASFLQDFDLVFGNLEGPLAKEPPAVPAGSLKFAFPARTAEILAKANFKLVSLANNHTADLGKEGLVQTKVFLKTSGLESVGEPVGCHGDFFITKDKKAVFLAFNKTFSFNCADKDIVEAVKEVRAAMPQQTLIVSFHWGEEYKGKSNFLQQELAHKIIEAGVDLILGHHPHVVQEIEVYQGKLIFYSLGNFIFDQFFSEETQKGLMVGLEVYPDKKTIRLFPFRSQLAQPALMGGEEKRRFLEELAAKSSPSLREGIKAGIISF